MLCLTLNEKTTAIQTLIVQDITQRQHRNQKTYTHLIMTLRRAKLRFQSNNLEDH